MPEESVDKASATDFPVANVRTTQPLQLARRSVSRLWWVALLCLGIAGWLTWAETSSRGVTIEVTFPEGHGLQPGDAVKYLGIDVGEVQSVGLDDAQRRALVTIVLIADAGALAREGAQFWIERPDISIGRARGLDTLVGGRYVGMAPGPAQAPPTRRFTGLDDAPTSVHGTFDGLEIVLDAQQRYGLQRGSPVSYRGVEIGHVMSVGLANDAASVVARTHIQPQYQTLVRDNSRFWSTSGIGVKLGLTGLQLDAETLATIAAGGVALATPGEPGAPVSTGHRFSLAKSPENAWLDWQPRLAIGTAQLRDNGPMPQPVLAARQASGFRMFGRTEQRGWLLLLDDGAALGPADLLRPSEEKKASTLEAWGETLALSVEGAVVDGALAMRTVPSTIPFRQGVWPRTRLRIPSMPEEVVVTCGSDDLTMTLAKERFASAGEGGERWLVDESAPLDESWHGAACVALSDGQVIGVLVYGESRAAILPLTKELIAP